jgi:L-lactate dehydrogenase complex protein LldE
VSAIVFPTCLVEQLRPELTATVVDVVAASGTPATVARGVTCCGQPAWNAGFLPEARRVARTSLKALAKTDGPIVVPSGSCATMMHEYWPELLGPTAAPVAERVVELSQFLAAGDSGGNSSLNQRAIASRTVTYHDSCHMLRTLGVKGEPRALLADAGVGVKEMPSAERCCGFGGTFSVKLPEVSVAMADEKLDEAVATGCDTMVGCDLSCLVHLEGRARRRGLPLRFRHLAEVLADG